LSGLVTRWSSRSRSGSFGISSGSPRSSWRPDGSIAGAALGDREWDDRLVSTMRKHVEALGGKLRLQAVFEGGKVLEISE
jgi:hypothetical protein